MSERSKRKIEYIGYEKPETPLEIEFEIAGLKLAILQAEERIASLEQSKILAKIELEKRKHE
jgi:hypothetical protein